MAGSTEKLGDAKLVHASSRASGGVQRRRNFLCQARLPTAIAFTWRAGFLVWQKRKRGQFMHEFLVLLLGKFLSNHDTKEQESIVVVVSQKVYKVFLPKKVRNSGKKPAPVGTGFFPVCSVLFQHDFFHDEFIFVCDSDVIHSGIQIA